MFQIGLKKVFDFNIEDIVSMIYEKELQNTNQTEFIIENIKKKCDKLHIKWKGSDNSFNS